MNHTLSQLIKLIAFLLLAVLVIATAAFTFIQLKRGQTIDETLVSNLTTQLDTQSIDQAVTKITPSEK